MKISKNPLPLRARLLEFSTKGCYKGLERHNVLIYAALHSVVGSTMTTTNLNTISMPPFCPNRQRQCHQSCNLKSSRSFNKMVESGWVRPNILSKFLTIFEGHKSWHRSYVTFLGNFFLCIDVNLVELDRGFFRFCPFFNMRSDRSARSAPYRPEINHNGMVAIDDLVELVVAVILSSMPNGRVQGFGRDLRVDR